MLNETQRKIIDRMRGRPSNASSNYVKSFGLYDLRLDIGDTHGEIKAEVDELKRLGIIENTKHNYYYNLVLTKEAPDIIDDLETPICPTARYE